MTLYAAGNVLWVVGTILIVLGWVDVVDKRVAWAGFAVALVGAILTWLPRRKATSTQTGNDPPGAPRSD
jgi:membrane-bound ClpP family serine protease